MSDELTVWLQGCLDDVEQVARAAGTCECGRCEPPLDWTIEGGKFISALGVNLGHTVAPGYINPEQAEHIARHDPARVLAQVAATRRIIAEHTRVWIEPGHPHFNDAHLTKEPMPICRSCEPMRQFRREQSWPCRTLKLLALPYAGRDGYKEEWSPDA